MIEIFGFLPLYCQFWLHEIWSGIKCFENVRRINESQSSVFFYRVIQAARWREKAGIAPRFQLNAAHVGK